MDYKNMWYQIKNYLLEIAEGDGSPYVDSNDVVVRMSRLECNDFLGREGDREC